MSQVSPPPPPLPAAESQSLGDNAGMRMLLPVGRSAWAIAAGYVGLISVLVVPAPLAILLSIIAIRHIRKSKATEHPKHGMGRAIFGLVMGVIFTTALIGWILVVTFSHGKITW
jgi:hypothetical protein